MDLHLPNLVSRLLSSQQHILKTIHEDPLLLKNTCPTTGLTIANASKQLFTPTAVHQLYAKGIIYETNPFKLVSLPYIKMYNVGENPNVDVHVATMLTNGSHVVCADKYDGTFIMRTVYKGQVIFSTRGVMETHVTGNKYFKWVRDICAEKYPILLDPTFAPYTPMYFELVGPENQVVTRYPNWDLVLTGGYRAAWYLSTEALNGPGGLAWSIGTITTPASYKVTTSLPEALQAMSDRLAGTDKEGVVIQFECPTTGMVLGRVKAKPKSYIELAKVFHHCSYKRTVELSKALGDYSWEALEAHLKSISTPEELLSEYQEYHRMFAAFVQHCRELLQAILDADQILKDDLKSIWGNLAFKELYRCYAVEAAKAPKNIRDMLFMAMKGRLTLEKVMESQEKNS